jgi:hypothetical protein
MKTRGLRGARSSQITPIRGVLVAGGAVALAAFLQAIWKDAPVEPLRSAIATGITWLVVGTAVAATIPFMRYVNVFSKNPKDPVRNPFWWVWAGAQALAVLCFVIGMMTAVWGVANAWKL